MLCFAANSLLCRLALAPKLIDPATFTSVRILSAAALLTACVLVGRGHLPRRTHASARSIAALLGYMAFFSFGYTRLSAGTGALLLIGGVQLTMLYVAWREGERFSPLAWLGLGLALLGVLYLLLPGVSAPDPLSAALMAISGACFGLFSLLARRGSDPVEVNASNMLWCLPPVVLVNLFLLGTFIATPAGLALAIASGALATGFGYIVWYLAVRSLTAGQAATVQLSMPAVTALGGVVFLAEPLSLRLLIASAAMIGGIAIVMVQRAKPSAA
ncbi:MAG: DMT family transporter [Enhydrobacter sp.]|nr:DMT family transporter [Enhydrobacter sp.]